MAMTRTAPISSTMANATKKTFNGKGTRRPSRAMMPSTNAMSVAIGMPQPRAPSVPPLTAM